MNGLEGVDMTNKFVIVFDMNMAQHNLSVFKKIKHSKGDNCKFCNAQVEMLENAITQLQERE